MSVEIMSRTGELTGAGVAGMTRRSPARAGMRHPLVGVGVALASAAAFGTSGPFAKSMLVSGWSPGLVTTLRLTIAALVLLVPALMSLRGKWGVLWRSKWLVVGYGLTGVAGAQLAYFNAVNHLSVGVALLLEYLAPTIIVGWLWARHRQTPRRLTVTGIGLSMIGLLLVLNLAGGARVSLIGVVWGLVAAVCLTMYFLLSDQVDADLPPIALAGVGLFVGAVALWTAGLFGIVDLSKGATRVDLAGTILPWWVPLLVIALLAAAFAYVTGIVAVRMLGAKVASFVALSEVLFAVLFAWLVLSELPSPIQLGGGVLIIAGLVAVRTDESRSSVH